MRKPRSSSSAPRSAKTRDLDEPSVVSETLRTIQAQQNTQPTQSLVNEDIEFFDKEIVDKLDKIFSAPTTQLSELMKIADLDDGVGLDLREVDLQRQDLENLNLSGADLRNADLSRTKLAGTLLEDARLEGTKFPETRLRASNEEAPSPSTHIPPPAARREIKYFHFLPLFDRVLVRPESNEERSLGGVIIPDTAAEKPSHGVILSVGPGARDEFGKLIPIDLEVGDYILFGKWAGSEIQLNGERLLILKESEVMGVLEFQMKAKMRA